MFVDLTVIATCMAIVSGVTVLIGKISSFHSRLDVMRNDIYCVKEDIKTLEKDVKELIARK